MNNIQIAYCNMTTRPHTRTRSNSQRESCAVEERPGRSHAFSIELELTMLTDTVNKTRKKQLITRIPNISDKRSIKLLLSKRGKSIADSVNESISQNIQKILDKYDFDTANQMMNSLESLGWDLYLYRQNMD